MSQCPTRIPKHAPPILSIEDALINILLIGQYYADVFANLATLATTIQHHQASNLDSASDVAQLRTLAEGARAELELQLAQIREFLDGFSSPIEMHTAHEDGIEPYAMEPSTTTKH